MAVTAYLLVEFAVLASLPTVLHVCECVCVCAFARSPLVQGTPGAATPWHVQ